MNKGNPYYQDQDNYMGTYNYLDPKSDVIGHSVLDVIPYSKGWGNTPDDNSPYFWRWHPKTQDFLNKSFSNESKEEILRKYHEWH